jgi:pimeloyl-ACP methyl ester carboxylesterase
VPSVAANGLEIGYDTAGAGPPLVMLHGATSIGREDWAAQVPLFGRAFRLYMPDARGHGRTRWDAADGWSNEMTVDDLLAFVDTLRLETFHLLGFSMGAMTALTFATRHPERLRTLVIAGITTQREPRASVARRLMDPARADADPAWAAILARRHDAGHRGRRRGPAVADAARHAAGGAAGDGLRRRSGPVRACRPCLGHDAPAPGRPAVRRAGLRPRAHGPAAGVVQRGLWRLLPLDRIDRQ